MSPVITRVSPSVFTALKAEADKLCLSVPEFARMLLSQHALAAQPTVPTQPASQHGEHP